jgi:2-polyprenyl-6-methoxyphenol hydroxylase-like FAD-dependent oxidoreductase
MAAIKVLIIGAGLGGLTLAQSLRGSGIDVEIFEGDKSPWDRHSCDDSDARPRSQRRDARRSAIRTLAQSGHERRGQLD